MPISCNYPLKFCQNNLLQFACSSKKTAEKLTDNIVSISNIYQSYSGVCRGLAHAYIAYENNQLGSEFIEQLNTLLILINDPILPKDPVQKQVVLANKKLAFKWIKKHYLTVLKLQINHERSVNYRNMSRYIENTYFEEEKSKKTNLDYLTFCLLKYKPTTSNIDYTDKINSIEAPKTITGLYSRIEAGLMITNPNMVQANKDIYTKIKEGKRLSTSEMKSFIKDAYHYCGLLYEYNTTVFNAEAGIIYNNYKPSNAYENVHHKRRTLSRYELKNEINRAVALKKNFFTLYAAKRHAMAVTATYIKQNDTFQFSFFEPNKGVITTDNKNKFLDIINKIDMNNQDTQTTPTYQHSINSDKEKIMGEELSIQTDTKNSRRLMLPKIQEKDVQILAKKQLIENKTAITLKNKSKLNFINYNIFNDELTLSLPLGKRTFTIYSELNDINQTVDLINNSMQEFPSYMGNDIYIDWKGQILNRLSKH